MFPTRVFISAAMDANLGPEQLKLKKAVLRKIERAEFEPQEFVLRGLPAQLRLNWGFNAVQEVMARCQGAVILAFSQPYNVPGTDKTVYFPSEFNHFEGSLALANHLPTLIVTEEGVSNRGIVWSGLQQMVYIPPNATATWTRTPQFEFPFEDWRLAVQARPQVFFGYCSKAQSTADAIIKYLTLTLKVSVSDWAIDFLPGGTILDRIGAAAKECLCGMFLFTKDDPLQGPAPNVAAPRDNVVFEAGYFIRARGNERTLIIREDGAKMPADLGGNIYVNLPDRNNTATIETDLRKFLEARL